MQELASLKGLSHWRRRRRDCRDWSVAATRVTRETKKWLALSPRIRRRDCRDWSVAATRETKTWLALSRPGDVSETCWRLKKSPKNRTCLNFPRLHGDPARVQETSRRRLRNQRRLESSPSRHLVSRPVSPGSRGKFKHVWFVWGGGGLFPVSGRSRRRLRDVSISCATSRRLILSATGETSPRRLRDLMETKETAGDVAATVRRRRGDVAAIEKTSRRRRRNLLSNWLSPCLEWSGSYFILLLLFFIL